MKTIVINRPTLGYVSAPSLAKEIGAVHATVRQGTLAPPADLYIRWGTTNSVSSKDAKVMNSAKAIHRSSDKRGFRMLCGDLSPRSWFHIHDAERELLTLEDERVRLNKPVVVRSGRHAGGSNFWLCNTYDDLLIACEKAGQGYYISEYIPKEREFRVHCVQGRVVGLSEKHPADPNEPVWNYHPEDGDQQWTNFKWGDWPMDVIRYSLAAFKLSRLHFGAVDIMHDGERPYVLEINSAPTLSPYRANCYGRALKFSLDRGDLTVGPYEYDDVGLIENWRQAIHPGLIA